MIGLRTPQPAPASGTQTNPPAGPSPKLVNAAHEFEASMMKELMGPIVSGQDSLDGDDEGSESALTSFAGEALSKAISEHGGFGIATRILHQLSAAGNHSGNASVPNLRKGITTRSALK